MFFINRIPGFRTNKEINKFISGSYYLFTFVFIMFMYNDLSLMVLLSTSFVFPFILLGLIDIIKDKRNHTFENIFKKIICPFIIVNCIILISLLLSSN